MLKKVIEELKKMNIYIAPFGVSEEVLEHEKEVIVYEYYPDVKPNEFSLKFRIISSNLLRAIEIREELIRRLINKTDRVKLNGFTNVKIEGANGTINDEVNNCIHLITTFKFTWREENE